MARNSSPACKICRREGMKLFLKGERCSTPRCAMERKGYPPGQHGKNRRFKRSEFGIQLREKQKIRDMYGLLEGQFKHFFEIANRQKGVTGATLIQMLESRLDNVVFRMGLAPSRRAARQLVRHRHYLVNGRILDIPSYICRPGDVIRVRERSRKMEIIHDSMRQVKEGAIVPYLSLDKAKMEGTYLQVPSREDIPITVNEQLVVEMYSR
jgi:small subunit ribosomal protein S4